MSGVEHGPDCWPWECVCSLQMSWEETVAAEDDNGVDDGLGY